MNASSAPAEARVILVDDRPAFRKHLAQIIHADAHMTVCGEADHPWDAMQVITSRKPDVAVVSISRHEASAADLITSLKVRGIKVPVLVVSIHDQFLHAERLLQEGASGCIVEHECVSETRPAIRKIRGGEIYLSASITRSFLLRLRSPQTDPRISKLALLTERELEVFRLLGAGFKIREIADDLHLSETAVVSHRFRIRRKLEMRNSAELCYHAANWEGLVKAG